MSDGSQNIQPEIASVLERLKQRIRRYVLLEGVALVVVTMSILFWISLGVDVIYFEFSRLDLPVWFRAIFRVVAATLVVLGFSSWVVLRLVRSFRAKALAMVLERRFPELDDRLISAVELSESEKAETPALTRLMIQQTIESVSAAVQKLDLASVFDRVPMRRAFLTATVLVTSILAFTATNSAALQRWIRAYVSLEDAYWERETSLVCKVVAQPGDVVKEFEEFDDRFEYRHPRGADLSLVIEVPEERRPDGNEWKSPDRVVLDIESATGGGNRVPLSTEPYRYSISQVQDDLEIGIQGGDFINMKPYVIRVVDQPRVDGISLDVDYPAYTGLNEVSSSEKAVQGSEISLPMETRFVLKATSNKSLTGMRVISQPEQFELEITEDSTRLVLLDEDGNRTEVDTTVAPWNEILASDGSGFQLPIQLTSRTTEERVADRKRLALMPETDFRIYLSDTDGITSLEPERLSLRAVADEPPEFSQMNLRGVSRSITRKAVIPMTGRISDDYGIATARFEFQIDDEETWNPRPFNQSPRQSPRDFILQRGDDEEFERFEVLPLDLSVGQKLALTVFAADGDNLNGPNEVRSQEFVFKIVTTEELLLLLNQREINLRNRFEQIIREVREKRAELVSHREKYEQWLAIDPETEDEELRQKRAKLLRDVFACAGRSMVDVPKNQNETIEIQQSFEDILAELVNNGVHTSQMVSRLDELIVVPLKEITTGDFPAVMAAVYEYKTANDNSDDPRPAIDSSVQLIDTMLARMDKVLSEMEDLAEFHETLQALKDIIDRQKELSEDTKKRQKEKFIENLRKLEELNN